MKSFTKITLILTVATALATGGVAYAKHAVSSGEGPMGILFLSKIASLGITDVQKDKIHIILREHQPKMEPMVRQCIAERRALRDMIRFETVDEKTIRAQSAKVATLEADLAVQRAHAAQEVRATLKPDQIEKARELQSDVDARLDHVVDRIADHLANK